MKQEALPAMKEIYGALEAAALDLYGLALVCQGGSPLAAEPEVLATLFLGLENSWFVEDSAGKLSHQEFREEFFRALWEKSQAIGPSVRIGTDVPLGHEEMGFYQLSRLARAAVYLRTKRQFSYASLSLILGTAEPRIREEVERAREFLLGHRVKPLDWSEEDF
jgi:hypothetical protein